MLGLKYGCVQLAPWHPEWPAAYREERARLAVALSGIPCEIEHIGSSSVPGLTAKPIIDIAVGLPGEASTDSAISAVQMLGYEYRGDAAAEGGHVLVRESAPLLRTHHVHVVGLRAPQWEAYLILRDYLRRSDRAREAYATKKVELAERYSSDHRAYTKAKDGIVQALLADARRPTRRCS